MAIRPPMPDTVDIYSPYGSAAPTQRGVPCRLVPNLRSGRGAISSTNYLQWTHWIDLDKDVVIRDNCSRGAGTTITSYADGDQVAFTKDGMLHSFVVVWVELRYTNTPAEYKRAYLHRDDVLYVTAGTGGTSGSTSGSSSGSSSGSTFGSSSPTPCPTCTPSPASTPTGWAITPAGFGGSHGTFTGASVNSSSITLIQATGQPPCCWQFFRTGVEYQICCLSSVGGAGPGFQVAIFGPDGTGGTAGYTYLVTGSAACNSPHVANLSAAGSGLTGPATLTITPVP